MAKTALVLGGTGQIGYATCAALTAAGWDVTAAARGRHRPDPPPEATPLVLDRADDAAVRAAAAGHDLVVDTLAFGPSEAEQLLDLDVGALVVISTAAVYRGRNGTYLDVVTGPDSFPDYPVPVGEDWPVVTGDEPTYSPQKAAMERVLLAGRTPVSVLRAGAVYGPHNRQPREWFFVRRALDRRSHVWLAYDGQSRFHPAATANVAALVLACAERPGTRVLNAADPSCPTEAEIGLAVLAALDAPVEVRTFTGPPRDGVGVSPWGNPRPFVLAMDQAVVEVGYVPALSHAEAVAAAARSAVQAHERAARTGRDWRDVFPGLLDWDPERWFDYAAEDAFRPWE